MQIDLSTQPEEKHIACTGSAAVFLTNDRDSVQVTIPPDSPKAILAAFTIPKAREMDVVAKIMRECSMFMEDYEDQTVGFPNKPGK